MFVCFDRPQSTATPHEQRKHRAQKSRGAPRRAWTAEDAREMLGRSELPRGADWPDFFPEATAARVVVPSAFAGISASSSRSKIRLGRALVHGWRPSKPQGLLVGGSRVLLCSVRFCAPQPSSAPSEAADGVGKPAQGFNVMWAALGGGCGLWRAAHRKLSLATVAACRGIRHNNETWRVERNGWPLL